MKLFILILVATCSIVMATDIKEVSVNSYSFPEEYLSNALFPRPQIIAEERAIECTNNCADAIKSNSKAVTRDSIYDDGRLKSGIGKAQIKTKLEAHKDIVKSADKSESKSKPKNATKKLQKARNSLKASAALSEEKPFGEPAAIPKMSEASNEDLIFASSGKAGGSINIGDPSKAQFEVERDDGNLFSSGINNIEQSFNDNLGLQVPTTLFNGNFKVPFINGLALKLSGQEEDRRTLKKTDVVANKQTESRKKLSAGARKTNIDLTTKIIQLLIELNIGSKDPLSLSRVLMRVKIDLSKHQDSLSKQN